MTTKARLLWFYFLLFWDKTYKTWLIKSDQVVPGISGISITDPDNEELELGKVGPSTEVAHRQSHKLAHTHKLAHQQDSDVLYLVSFQLKNRPTQRKFALFALPKSVEEREYHNSGTHKLRLRRMGEASDKMQRSAGKKLWAWTFGVLILWGGWFCVWQSVLCSMVVVVWWVWESRFRCGHQVTLGLLGPWTRLRSHLWAHLGLVWSGRVYFGLLLHLVDLVGLFCWLANTFL